MELPLNLIQCPYFWIVSIKSGLVFLFMPEKGHVMYQNLQPGGTKVKKLNKTSITEMPKKAPSQGILRRKAGCLAFSDKDPIL